MIEILSILASNNLDQQVLWQFFNVSRRLVGHVTYYIGVNIMRHNVLVLVTCCIYKTGRQPSNTQITISLCYYYIESSLVYIRFTGRNYEFYYIAAFRSGLRTNISYPNSPIKHNIMIIITAQQTYFAPSPRHWLRTNKIHDAITCDTLFINAYNMYNN